MDDKITRLTTSINVTATKKETEISIQLLRDYPCTEGAVFDWVIKKFSYVSLTPPGWKRTKIQSTHYPFDNRFDFEMTDEKCL